MGTVAATSDSSRLSVDFTHHLVEAWVNSCNEFLRWQRRELIDRKPAPTTSSEHRQTLKVMLRLGRSFYAQVSDPDFPLPEVAAEVGGKLRQLEKSWEMIHNPISDSEADSVLRQAFPDEPGAGSAA